MNIEAYFQGYLSKESSGWDALTTQQTQPPPTPKSSVMPPPLPMQPPPLPLMARLQGILSKLPNAMRVSTKNLGQIRGSGGGYGGEAGSPGNVNLTNKVTKRPETK